MVLGLIKGFFNFLGDRHYKLRISTHIFSLE